MDPSTLLHFFSQYGLLILYLWLLVGIFIVPVPEEIVMLTVGILISRGDFSILALFVACAGSLSGVTVSYFLGRYLGRLLIVKYGRWVGVSEKRLTQGEALFKHYGRWSLPIGYFLPGTRHLVSVIAGTTHFGWKRFALYAYPAGVLWVALLVGLGYFAGNYWLKIFHLFGKYFYYFIVLVCVVFAISFLVYWYKFRKKPQK
ncbi:MAG: DedA family protein [Chlamydiales bacterium]